MMQMQSRTCARAGLVLAAVLIAALVAGCHISSRGRDGKEDVSVETPLGGLAVKTDPSAVLGRIGLPRYPGSTPTRDKGTDKDSADVNLSFGSFHLRVQAAGFETGDDPAKVEDFYRKALSQFSDVIACENERPVGSPAKTGLGLTCKTDRHIHAEIDGDGNGHRTAEHERVLKAGSPTRQHLVTLEPRDGGTRFGLVALDLPITENTN